MAHDVRKPPVGERLKLHKQGIRGWCGWCGGPVEDKTPGRGWLKWWHDACAEEMAIIEQPDRARDAVFRRDKGICCDCGEDWGERYVFRPGTNTIICPHIPRWEQEQYRADREAGFWRYQEIIWVSLWHVDHKVPLWKVRHMPPLQRLEYFKLQNLVTRCHRCHGFKTKKEAPERAKFKAQAPEKERPPKPSKKWASRPFPKGPKKPWPKRKM